MTDAPAMQQEQRVEAPHAPVMSSQAGLSSQGEACLAPEIPELKAQPVAVESPPPSQFAVVVLTTDPRMLEQYDGLVVTQQKIAATSKGKGKAVATVDNESDYEQSSSEDERESEEGELAAQRFQHVQRNKKLALKKANAAKARDAQQHWAINDFSGCIPNRLGVKVWGPNDVEQLNSCF
ncbi:hypothetical protein C0995_007562 [Termitomyces sp. Mi166|nr:hypothetical protein C0995_007562 [Termitomyces sp. Mi166\